MTMSDTGACEGSVISRNCKKRRSGQGPWGLGEGRGLERGEAWSRAHPVVVASLLQRGTEVEAAAGHARISGTLDVPVEEAGAAVVPAASTPPAPPAAPRPAPPHGVQYLARPGTSGLVLSITTCLPCLSAAWQELTQRCHDPSVSCGTRTVTSQCGEPHPRTVLREGGCSLTLLI